MELGSLPVYAGGIFPPPCLGLSTESAAIIISDKYGQKKF